MNVYHPYPAVDSYDSFYLTNIEEGNNILDRFLNCGKYQSIEEKDEWRTLNVDIESLGTKRGDFFGITGHSFICNNKAWEILEPLISNDVKLFPVKYRNDTYLLVKVTNVIDCLDHTKADVFRSSESGRVLIVNKYAFKEELIENENFFAISEIKFSILVSQEFKDCVENNKLEGLLFQKVA